MLTDDACEGEVRAREPRDCYTGESRQDGKGCYAVPPYFEVAQAVDEAPEEEEESEFDGEDDEPPNCLYGVFFFEDGGDRGEKGEEED